MEGEGEGTHQNAEHIKSGRRVRILIDRLHMGLADHGRRPPSFGHFPWKILAVGIVILGLDRHGSVDAVKLAVHPAIFTRAWNGMLRLSCETSIATRVGRVGQRTL